MKALIFNSGLGKRMGEMTADRPKSMVFLKNGETIFERQIRILSECGITDFVVTTGPFKEMLEAVANKTVFKNLNFEFVENPIYDKTNCIYSMSLITNNIINNDIVCLHGDLVFDKQLVKDILNDNRKSLCLINEDLPLPEKDFKGKIVNGKLQKISVDIFDKDCYAFQPLYKLSSSIVNKWCEKVIEFVNNGNVNVYAENALNELTNDIIIESFSYKNYYIDEIDNKEDYERVSEKIRLFDYKEQEIFSNDIDIKTILDNCNAKNILLITNKYFLENEFIKNILNLDYNIVIFDDFSPNPKYDDVVKAIDIFNKNNCNFIISIGGGSSIDIGKSVKIMTPQNNKMGFLNNEYNYSYIKHLAIPTTAGTGSESTRFAVMYYDGLKRSLMTDCILPDYVILNSDLLKSLPDYQKKCTLLDALCQSIESIWARNSTDDSHKYSKKSIELIFDNYKNYLNNDDEAIRNMLIAANYSGKAINISQTTAAHALSYKITSEYNLPHGHAVAICMNIIWEYMIELSKDNKNLEEKLNMVTKFMNCSNIQDAYNKYKSLFDSLELEEFIDGDMSTVEEFTKLVNLQRLNNNPIIFNENDIKKIYSKIFKK